MPTKLEIVFEVFAWFCAVCVVGSFVVLLTMWLFGPESPQDDSK